MKTTPLFFAISVTALTLFIYSCKSKEDKLKDEIKPILTKLILQDSLATKVDSLLIYNIDTLSELDFAKQRLSNLERNENYYIEYCHSLMKQANLEAQSAELSASKVKLYSEVLDSRTLVESELLDLKRYSNKAKELMKENELYKDSAKQCLKQIEALSAKIDGKKIDSTTFKGYIAYFNLYGADNKNMEIKKDSLRTYLSPGLRIIKPKSM